MSDIVNGLTFQVPGSRLKPVRKKATCRQCGSIIIVGVESKRVICAECAGRIENADLRSDVEKLTERLDALEAELATR